MKVLRCVVSGSRDLDVERRDAVMLKGWIGFFSVPIGRHFFFLGNMGPKVSLISAVNSKNIFQYYFTMALLNS
jgi:hypothetical protein